jgi:transcriptional regulator GlxA family with amidase domain
MTVKTIAIAIHHGVQALDIAGPVDVFNETNNFISYEDRYETVLIAATHSPLRASNKMQLVPDLAFDEAPKDLDIVLVAGGPELPVRKPDARLVLWLNEVCPRVGLYGSICTGAFTLGHAGLLDGHRVTTHWQHVQELSMLFPTAHVEPDAIFVQDGRLVTSAGVTAGIDLALALVGQHHGPEIAVSVAKRLVVVAQRQGGQSQFSPYLTAPADPGSPAARIQEYVMANIGCKHSLQMLAAEAGMSARSLTRYFLREAGITVHEFVNRARIDAARMRLERSSLPLKTIAYECGFRTADRMRLLFNARLGVTPTQYRATFRQHELHKLKK